MCSLCIKIEQEGEGVNGEIGVVEPSAEEGLISGAVVGRATRGKKIIGDRWRSVAS